MVGDEEVTACFSKMQRSSFNGLQRLRGANVVDLLRLAACRRVLQVVKYSSFSTAAVLMGGGQLVNFYGPNNSAIANYEDLARVHFFTPDVDPVLLNQSVVGEPLAAQDALGCTADNIFCHHTPQVVARPPKGLPGRR